MVARPVRGAFVAALALALLLPSGGCADPKRRTAASSQREQLIRAAEAALRRYNATTPTARSYAGRTAKGRGVRVRVSARGRVDFSLYVRCSGRTMRAFPDRPPRLRRAGAFAYAESGRGYRFRVSGRVGSHSAHGSAALRVRPARGRACRTRTAWRAARG